MSGASERTRERPSTYGSILGCSETLALWSGTNMNRDVSTGPLARPFAHSFALVTRSLAPDCSLRSLPLLRSLVRSFVTSLTPSWESELWMSQNDLVLSHSDFAFGGLTEKRSSCSSHNNGSRKQAAKSISLEDAFQSALCLFCGLGNDQDQVTSHGKMTII